MRNTIPSKHSYVHSIGHTPIPNISTFHTQNHENEQQDCMGIDLVDVV